MNFLLALMALLLSHLLFKNSGRWNKLNIGFVPTTAIFLVSF
ncbi:hypothetical protein RV18_GL000835 [Enterococcus termitis]|nr:hypothetical protein RV18_GL000835 [Enterococcus termitis]